MSVAGGGHWSLLVYRRGDGSPARFEHYDSCKGANATHARAVAKCLVALLDPDVGGATTQLVAMQSPQQVCGTTPRTAGCMSLLADPARTAAPKTARLRLFRAASLHEKQCHSRRAVCTGERVRLWHVRALHRRAALRHRRPDAGCRGEPLPTQLHTLARRERNTRAAPSRRYGPCPRASWTRRGRRSWICSRRRSEDPSESAMADMMMFRSTHRSAWGLPVL